LKEEKITVKLYTSTCVDNIDIKLKELKIINLDYIIISYYSNQNNLYNQIVNKQNIRDIVLNNIKYSLDIGLNTEVHIVPMSINLFTLVNTVSELIDIGVNKISLLKLVLQGRALNKNYLQPNKKELAKIIKILQQKYKNKIRLGLPFSEGKCIAGIEKLVVLSNGKIIPCDSYKSGQCLCERWQNQIFKERRK
jgi:MoaA/NifB/PqqE/SkfB family radical SAM enzyme